MMDSAGRIHWQGKPAPRMAVMGNKVRLGPAATTARAQQMETR